MKEKVLIAMSGGVDSTLAAHIMKEKGYDVIGVTIKFFDEQEDAIISGEKAAKELGIDWYWANYTEHFKEDVMAYFIRTYMQGKTPNPCAHCNRHAKFNYLYREMKAKQCTKIITGHYSRKVQIGDYHYFKKGLDPKKDQSYYLALLKDFQREVIEFPLGEMNKIDVKAKAAELNLSVADQDESQDICFLMDGDYRNFLEDKLSENSIKKGWFIMDGKRFKEHKGIIYYTVGQRKGLGIGYHEPLFVKSIDADTGDIVVCKKDEVTGRGVKVHDCVFPSDHDRVFRAEVKIRYRMAPVGCLVEVQPDNKATILFDEPEFAPTPGQIACVYENDVVVGGGYIQSVF
ncbi:MAG: tRNA 2-thiouridine(34) synthase MnmA [Denitrovibrio sp.]|nr:MAG: tRNA 2-thiouridine(34) synthase MnmA [Denitrovibrio sp.]